MPPTDIKPENILIADDGKPLLTDFGSTRLANISVDSRAQALQVADMAAQHSTGLFASLFYFI